MNNNGPSDKMKQNIRNVFWLYVALFCALVVHLAYFVFVSSPQIVNSPHNPRISALDNEMRRGSIFASGGEVIAESIPADGGYIREYANGRNMSHIIGYVGKGKSGIEARYNFDLQRLHFEVWQRIRNMAGGTPLVADSLWLTIDMDIQTKAYEQLNGVKGAIVVMEPDTGKILAMASYPDFDPNSIAENWEDLVNSGESPFLNRAAQGLYTPGSVFKIITAAAFIEEYEDFSEMTYVCEGEQAFQEKIIHCFDSKKHGEINIFEAFAYSCNTFFSYYGLELGAESLITSAEERYFNAALEYPLEYNRSIFQLNEDATESEIVETSIGQGRTLVSPLHMAMITSAVANGGIMMKPYIVDHITAYNGRTVSKNLPQMLDTVFTIEHASALRDMMGQAVQYGTATGAAVSGAEVFGKTGTAQNPNGTSHSWFTSFAEKNGSMVSVTVVLENPEQGRTAVPIAKSVLDAALNKL